MSWRRLILVISLQGCLESRDRATTGFCQQQVPWRWVIKVEFQAARDGSMAWVQCPALLNIVTFFGLECW